MKLATAAMIPKIDRYCAEELGIPLSVLIDRSGEAVARAVRAHTAPGGVVAVLAGRGNNGADGYAAAHKLLADYKVRVYDVLAVGQNSPEGQEKLEQFVRAGGLVIPWDGSEALRQQIKDSDCIVDSVFGTGFHGDMPPIVRQLAQTVREATHVEKIAVDVPLGVNADDGSVSEDAICVDATVELSYIKSGILSFPARGYVGQVLYDDLGLPIPEIDLAFDFQTRLIEKGWVRLAMPKRGKNTNKGSFGRLLVLAGSAAYRGAAALSLEGALRGGAGYVRYMGEGMLVQELSFKFPEAVYTVTAPYAALDAAQRAQIVAAAAKESAVLVGPGCGNTPGLYALVASLLDAPGGPLILDADAINALAEQGDAGRRCLKQAKRPVILTPHPLEFSRLCGQDVIYVQGHRMEVARRFAADHGVLLVLKGAGTVVTDGRELYLNHTGSSALAKAGSGDVLAGTLASLVASGVRSIEAAALAVYFHGRAADTLAKDYSSFGVIPSDLPLAIGKEMALYADGTNEE